MIGRIIIFSLLILIDCLISFANAQQPDTGWVDQLRNANGNQCCYDNDGRRLNDPDWDTLGKVDSNWSGYRVYEDGTWHEIPNWALVTGKNRDGIARVWWQRNYEEGSIVKKVFCFMPGTLG